MSKLGYKLLPASGISSIRGLLRDTADRPPLGFRLCPSGSNIHHLFIQLLALKLSGPHTDSTPSESGFENRIVVLKVMARKVVLKHSFTQFSDNSSVFHYTIFLVFPPLNTVYPKVLKVIMK